jgi:hypothetical protein
MVREMRCPTLLVFTKDNVVPAAVGELRSEAATVGAFQVELRDIRTPLGFRDATRYRAPAHPSAVLLDENGDLVVRLRAVPGSLQELRDMLESLGYRSWAAQISPGPAAPRVRV